MSKLNAEIANHLAAAAAGTGTPRWRRNGMIALGALALAYLVVRSKTSQAEREHPPVGKFVVADGVQLHYIEQGEGPVLVLLHGNTTMADDFKFSGLYDQLAQHFRVIAFDRPGFGYSERPRSTIWTPLAQARLLHNALQLLDAPEYLVLGHSWGSLVALAMALEDPGKVRGLLLLSGYYYPSARLDVPVAALPAIPILGDLMRYTVLPLLGRLAWPSAIKTAFSPRAVTRSFRRLPVWMMLRPSQLRATAAEAALMVPAVSTLQTRYPELTMPVAILAGKADLLVDPEHNSVRLHQMLDQSELTLVPDAGHMLQHLAQDQIVEAVANVAGQAGILPSMAFGQDGLSPRTPRH